jgi:ADP-ribose pyrophosphatase
MRTSNLVRDGNGWETKSSETHFASENLEVVTEIVQTPSRSTPRTWTTVHRKAAVIIAAMTADGRFLLVRQERIPIRAAIWEMPGGQIDETREPDEKKIKETALRELHEETGYDLAPDGELVPLGYYFSSPGFTDEHGYFFLARHVEPSAEHKREEGEGILECRGFSAADLRRMIAENEIRDANTLSICARLATRGFLPLNPQS